MMSQDDDGNQGRQCGVGVVVVGEVGRRDGWCWCWSARVTRWLVPLVVDALGFRPDGCRGKSDRVVTAGCDRSVSCWKRGGVGLM